MRRPITTDLTKEVLEAVSRSSKSVPESLTTEPVLKLVTGVANAIIDLGTHKNPDVLIEAAINNDPSLVLTEVIDDIKVIIEIARFIAYVYYTPDKYIYKGSDGLIYAFYTYESID